MVNGNRPSSISKDLQESSTKTSTTDAAGQDSFIFHQPSARRRLCVSENKRKSSRWRDWGQTIGYRRHSSLGALPSRCYFYTPFITSTALAVKNGTELDKFGEDQDSSSAIRNLRRILSKSERTLHLLWWSSISGSVIEDWTAVWTSAQSGSGG